MREYKRGGTARHLKCDLTQGNIRKGILMFAVPLMLSNIIQSMYNITDMYFVGAFIGTDGVSAVSVCAPIVNMLLVSLSGISAGVTVVISALVSKKEFEETEKAVGTALILYMLLGIGFMAAGEVLAPQILRIVHTPGEAFDEALLYLRIIFAGILFLFGYNLIGALQRGLGDSVSSMLYVLAAALINIGLDYLFVVILGMGVAGAAIATVCAQMCSFLAGLVQFQGNSSTVIRLKISKTSFDRHHLYSILRLGLPTACNEVMVNLAMLTVSGVANSFGLAQSAAYGIVSRIDGFAIFMDGAMNQAMSAYAAANISIGKERRAVKGLVESIKISAAIAVLTAVFVYLNGDTLIGIFDSTPEVVQCGESFLHIAVWSYVLFAIVGPLIGFVRGTGNVIPSVVVGFIAQCIFRIPFSFIFGRFFGFPGVAVAVLIGPLTSVTMYSIFIASGRWKKGILSIQKA